jgi:glycosyltransferase involved in cell wall biosynthesis
MGKQKLPEATVLRISVILVTYNRKQYLPFMLASLRRQTFKDYELILVNNGSSDGSEKMCADYAAADPRIRLINLPENGGASVGRNTGLAAASGEYVTFVDDDDRCEPSMLSFLYNRAVKDDADIAMCGSYNVYDDGNGKRIEDYFVGSGPFVFDRLQGLRELLKRELYNVAPPTKLFRRALWEGMAFPENVLVDDIHVIYKIFERAGRVSVYNVPLYYFRKHDTNMTAFIHNKQMTPELLDEYVTMYKTRAAYLLERAPEIAGDIEYSMHDFMEKVYKKFKG